MIECKEVEERENKNILAKDHLLLQAASPHPRKSKLSLDVSTNQTNIQIFTLLSTDQWDLGWG